MKKIFEFILFNNPNELKTYLDANPNINLNEIFHPALVNPFMFCCVRISQRNADIKCFEILINHDFDSIDFNLKNQYGRSIIYYIIMFNQIELFKMLLNKNINLNEIIVEDKMLIHYLCEKGKNNFLSMIL